MMKVLYVTTDNYPYHGACCNLLKKLFFDGDLSSKIDEVHVLTLQYTYADTCCQNVNGIIVHTYKSTAFMPVHELLHNYKHPLSTLSGVSRKFLEKIRSKFHKVSFMNSGVVKDIYRALKVIDAYKFNIIVAMSGAYEVAAGVAKFCMQNQVKMIFYQVDPCASNETFSISSRKCREQFEKELYSKASAVITTPIIYREKMKLYPSFVMDHVYAMEFPNISSYEPSSEQKDSLNIRCVFSGRLYPTVRDPEFVCRLFSEIKSEYISLELYGVSREELQSYLGSFPIPSNIHCHGLVELSVAQQAINEADVLINIGNNMKNQIPSKLFEYISSGKPIVNLPVHVDCPTLPYLDNYPYVLSLWAGNRDYISQAYKLENFLQLTKGKRISSHAIMSIYKKCTAEYCAEYMYNILKNAMKDGNAK